MGMENYAFVSFSLDSVSQIIVNTRELISIGRIHPNIDYCGAIYSSLLIGI